LSLQEKTLTKNTKLTNSLSSIKSLKKENKLSNILKNDVKITNTVNNYIYTEPSKPLKREEIIKKFPATSRNYKNTKMETSGIQIKKHLLNESNELAKTPINNKYSINNIKKNVSRRNFSVRKFLK